MKKFLVSALLVSAVTFSATNSSQALAETNEWTLHRVCDNGSMVIDSDSAYHRTFQIVLREKGIVSYFATALDWQPNTRNELIFSGLTQYRGEYSAYTGRVGGVRFFREGNGWRLVASYTGGREANWYFNDCSCHLYPCEQP